MLNIFITTCYVLAAVVVILGCVIFCVAEYVNDLLEDDDEEITDETKTL